MLWDAVGVSGTSGRGPQGMVSTEGRRGTHGASSRVLGRPQQLTPLLEVTALSTAGGVTRPL